MSEHTHLSSISVNGDQINFSFAQHEDNGIAGITVADGHSPEHLARQLQMLTQLGALKPEHVKAMAEQPGMEALGEKLYVPKPAEQPVAQDAGVVGGHTAAYLNSLDKSQGASLGA